MLTVYVLINNIDNFPQTYYSSAAPLDTHAVAEAAGNYIHVAAAPADNHTLAAAAEDTHIHGDPAAAHSQLPDTTPSPPPEGSARPPTPAGKFPSEVVADTHSDQQDKQ